MGLIVGIAGVSSSSNVDANGQLEAGSVTKASMGIFLAVFVILVLFTGWLFLQPNTKALKFQKKLFLAVALSLPFILVRMVFSAISNFSHKKSFDVLVGSPTIYLCMSVLEEIVAMVITMALGISAVLEKDFVRLGTKSRTEVGNKV